MLIMMLQYLIKQVLKSMCLINDSTDRLSETGLPTGWWHASKTLLADPYPRRFRPGNQVINNEGGVYWRTDTSG